MRCAQLMQRCEGLACFCGQISIKGLHIVFVEAASPQTVQGNVLDSRLRSALKYSVVTLSVKVIVTPSTTFSCAQLHGIAVFLLLLHTEKDKVLRCVSPPQDLRSFSLAGHDYCCIHVTLINSIMEAKTVKLSVVSQEYTSILR